MDIEKLQQLQTDYIKGLVEFSHSQKKFWKKLPYLALMADGRSGYNDNNVICYRYGFWRVGYQPGKSNYSYRVDCATGDICRWNAEHSIEKDCTGLLDIAISDLNAEAICQYLIAEGNKPMSSYMKSEEALRREQDEEIKRYNITKTYTRKK